MKQISKMHGRVLSLHRQRGFFLFGGGKKASYQVQRSIRLRKSAGASLSRTPGAAGNRKLLARRFRIKRGELGTLQVIASAGTSSIDRVYLDSSNRLCLDVLGTTRLVSNEVFRDPTAWHIDIELRLDVANATATSRAKLLVDGVELTYSTDSRASITNTDTNWNNTVVHYLGRDNAGNYFDGFLAEPIGVDGATSSAYTGTDATSGNLIAEKPVATYGTTGYYLDFSDPTSTTTLMVDRSGNGNNWTANNISLTAGATYDSMLDVPLGGGGQERGNYATLNALVNPTAIVYSNGNLRVNTPTGVGHARSSIATPTTGKWWCEFTPVSAASASYIVGIAGADTSTLSYGYDNNPAYSYSSLGERIVNGTFTSSFYATYNTGDVIRGELDLDNNQLTWFKNNVAQTTISVANGSYVFIVSDGSGSGSTFVDVNFGQQPAAHAASAGFKALHTGNLTNTTPVASGSFAGNLSADGPPVWCNGTPDTLTINGNAVTWGTHADRVANGFKVRSSSSSYNNTGSNTWSATFLSPSSKSAFKYQNAKANP